MRGDRTNPDHSILDPAIQTGSDAARTETQNANGNSVRGSGVPERGRAARRFLCGFALMAYGVLLCASGIAARRPDISAETLLTWELDKTLRLIDRLHDVPQEWLIEVARYLPIGFLVPLVLFGTRADNRAIRRGIFSVSVAVGFAAAIHGVIAGGIPTSPSLVLSSAGCVLGAWMGLATLRGPKGLLLLVPQLGLAAVLVMGLRAGLVYLVLQEAPLPIKPVQMSVEQRRLLLDRIRTGRSDQWGGDALDPLILSEHEAQQLLAWGLALDSADRKAEIRLMDNKVHLRASLTGLKTDGDSRHVNVEAEGEFSVSSGRPNVRLDKLTIGRITIPQAALAPMASIFESILEDEPDVRVMLSSVASLRIHDNVVDVLFSRPEILSATQAQVLHLISLVDGMPVGDAGFLAIFQSAFDLARIRSQAGEPIRENRAAILALSILFGQRRVEEFVGSLPDPNSLRIAQRRVRQFTLRGRTDWAQHFIVSGVVTLLANESLSDRVGVFKEELDAEEGGSGFSFADLLADRAGTMFAHTATRDDLSAMILQQRLTGEFSIDDLFPEATDLPEGISDADLESQYGGVGGAEYRRWEKEIDERLARCAALR